MSHYLRLGTRGSRLARVQTDMVAAALRARDPELVIEIIAINTSGDWRPEQGETPLPESEGGKALFAKELEEALLAGHIDAAVHSLKDTVAVPPPGLVIDHVLPRADARDALLTNHGKTLLDLANGATVGTTSPRRRALLLSRRPDLNVVPLRGNVPTRIEKLRAGQVDAMLLAVAGLRRLGLDHEIASVLEPQDMLPAAGQGIIGIELRADDARRHALFDKIHCHPTGLCAVAERAAVAALGGSCQTPLGCYAALAPDGALTLEVGLVAMDGTATVHERAIARVATPNAARDLGTAVGRTVRDRAPATWL